MKPLDTFRCPSGFVISTGTSVTPCASELAWSSPSRRALPLACSASIRTAANVVPSRLKDHQVPVAAIDERVDENKDVEASKVVVRASSLFIDSPPAVSVCVS